MHAGVNGRGLDDGTARRDEPMEARAEEGFRSSPRLHLRRRSSESLRGNSRRRGCRAAERGSSPSHASGIMSMTRAIASGVSRGATSASTSRSSVAHRRSTCRVLRGAIDVRHQRIEPHNGGGEAGLPAIGRSTSGSNVIEPGR
jgi:hypothetical protein